MNKPSNQSGTRQRESALFGVLRKYGASLPFADNVIATFQTEHINAGTVEGMLFAFDARIPLVFDRDWVIGDFESLPLRGERAMVRVTAPVDRLQWPDDPQGETFRRSSAALPS